MNQSYLARLCGPHSQGFHRHQTPGHGIYRQQMGLQGVCSQQGRFTLLREDAHCSPDYARDSNGHIVSSIPLNATAICQPERKSKPGRVAQIQEHPSRDPGESAPAIYERLQRDESLSKTIPYLNRDSKGTHDDHHSFGSLNPEGEGTGGGTCSWAW